MKQIYHHRLTPIAKSVRGGFIPHSDILSYAPMFDGQVLARDTAKNKNCNVEHRVYNDYLRKWDLLGTYYPDGTAIDSFGHHQRFTDNPIRPWAPIE